MGGSHAVLERFDVYAADMAEATGDVVGGKPRSSAVLARIPMPPQGLCPLSGYWSPLIRRPCWQLTMASTAEVIPRS